MGATGISPVPELDPPNTLLCGIVGSTAYGLDTPESDTDYIGIYVASTQHLLGLHPPSRGRLAIRGRGGDDAVYHEIGKAMALLLACNPTVSEALWLPNYIKSTPFGEELVELRTQFLSAKKVRDAFTGYATAQFHWLRENGRYQGSRDKRYRKHSIHLMRLLWQGYELYTTGTLPIVVPDPQPFFDFGDRLMVESGIDTADRLLAEHKEKIDNARTVLPEYPNEPPLEDFLLRVRKAHIDAILGE
jgi:uncharacterized protein